MSDKILGGANLPVEVVTDAPDNKMAVPVYGFTTLDRPLLGGPRYQVYIVSQAQIDSGEYELMPGPAQPVYEIDSRDLAQGVVPVYVVGGTLGATPAPPAQTYSQKVLAIAPANLIAYWPLNETSGLVADNAEGTAARDGAYTGVALNNSTFSNGDPVGLWDGANDYCNIQTASLAAAFNGAELTIGGWFKVAAGSVWTDGAVREIARFLVNGTNYLIFQKSSTNNQMIVERRGNSVTETVTISYSGTGWTHVAITVSQALDEMKVYLNGSQSGATQTGLGAWAGSLATTLLGAVSTGPVLVWNGHLAHWAVWTTPLPAAQVLQLATV